MKVLIAFILFAATLSPVTAFAASPTDAALGLAALAVFNQLVGGRGSFSRISQHSG